MAKLSIRLLFTVIMAMINLVALAQETAGGSALNNTMRSHNKIYLVMAVCLSFLTGMILYLVRLFRIYCKREDGVIE